MNTSQLNATEEAYNRAIELYKKAHPNEKTRPLMLQGTYKIEDVVNAVTEAKEKYGQRTTDSKVRKWLSYFSSQVTYYGQILDVLAQHHPEYVSLAWGTMKFVFVLVLNHEEMVTELSRAMSEIADVLPRVEIQLDIFKAENSIRTAVEELYAELIHFLFRTLQWYEQSPWRHAFTAFAAPFKLRFEDLKTRINRHARRIDMLASALTQAKVALMYEQLQKQHHQLQKLLEVQRNTNNSAKISEEAWMRLEPMVAEFRTLVVQNHSESLLHLTSISRDTTSISRDTKQIQIAMVLSVTKDTPLGSPLDAFRYCQAISRARPKRQKMEYTHLAPMLQAWATATSSSFIVIEGSAPSRSQTKDLATGLVSVLKEAPKPTVWALHGRAALPSSEEDPIHALKHLCSQILQANNEQATRQVSNSFNASRAESAVTETD